jgi:hypothetical protein
VKRRLFNFGCVLSLALLPAVVAIWVRSYAALDSLTLTRRFGDPDASGHGYTSLSLSWMLGTVSLGGGTVLDRLPPDERIFTWGSTRASMLLRRESPWLQFRSTYSSVREKPAGWSRGTVLRYWRVTVPCWAPALAALVLPASWLARRLAARRCTRRAALGRCTRCGYDLRNSPDRCPECGTPKTAPRPEAPAHVPV